MKIIGYRKSNFTPKDGGAEVKGYNVYIATDIDPHVGGGLSVERMYLSDAKLEREGIDLAEIMGQNVRVYYNRYGKVDSITLAD